MKRSFWVAAGVITVAVIAAIYYYKRDVRAEAPAFTTAEVSRGDVISTVEATGTLEAVTTVQVGSQVSGTISALHADFNSQVKKGQVIAELDSSLFQTQVEQARATVARLQADVERAKVQAADAGLKLTRAHELFDRQLIPKTDLETAESTARSADAAVKGAEAQIVQAKASLNQAQVNLGHTIITAPIDGVVIARNVDVGQTVAASMQAPTLFIIARDLTEMQVNASVDESDIGEIAPKQAVTFRVDAYPNETFTGTVAQVRLQPVVQQNVVSYVTVIDVPNRGAEAEAGHDGGRDHRDRARRRRAARCRTRRCASAPEARTCEPRYTRRAAGNQAHAARSPAASKRSRGLGARAGSADARARADRHQRRQRHRDSRRRSDAGRARRHRNGIDVGAGSGRTSHITAAALRTTRRRRRGIVEAGDERDRPCISVRDLTKTYAVGEIEVRALRGDLARRSRAASSSR